MKKQFNHSILMVVFGLMFAVTVAAEDWLRIDKSSNDNLQSLTGSVIHYDEFIFISAKDVPNRNDLDGVQLITEPFAFRIDSDRIDLLSDSLPDSPWFNSEFSNKSQFQLIQFNGPIKSEWLLILKQAGVQLVSPMAPFSWVVWASPSQLDGINSQAQIRHHDIFYPGFKVQSDNRNLAALMVPSMALVYFPRLEETKQKLLGMGADIQSIKPFSKQFSAINFNLVGADYLLAAQIPGIFTIQQIKMDAGPRGEMSQQSIVGAYDMNNEIQPGYATWLSDTGLDGSGITVSVVDGGIYENHPDLGGVIQCTGSSNSCNNSVDSHGTHVAGAIAGTGLGNSIDSDGFNRGLGVAPGSVVVEQLYGPMLSGSGPGGMVAGGMLAIYKDASTSDAQLSNNSWGPTGTPQGYDIPTMEIDMISRDANPDLAGHQPVLAVWSIMNGNGDRNFGSCAPSSLGSPDEAKNLFAVGSTKLQAGNSSQLTDIFDVSSNSAHGPACDGRLVPHIVAPGCSTEAPDSSSGYGMKCGTSMASPIISGSVSLFWEQYRNTYQAEPSPALVKATFTVVAQDLVGNRDADNGILDIAPSRQQGWGRVDLDTVINQSDAFWLYDQNTVLTQSGTNWQQELEPIDETQPMRLMLVWTDAPGPGTGGTSAAWVNDLDLIINANGNTFLGNVFGNDGYSEVGGNADGINNMEGAFLRTDQHNGNSITVEVLAANIAANALDPYNPQSGTQQDFALACFNCQEVMPDESLIFKDGFDNFIDLIFMDGFE